MFQLSFSSKRNLLKSPGLRLPSRPSSLCKFIASGTWRGYSNVPSAERPPLSHTYTPRTLSRYHRKIRTLDPAKLTSDDYLDFSSKVQPTVRVILQSPTPASERSPFSAAEWRSGPYPPGTRGFIYYYAPPHSSPLAGELRFRLTPSPDPASFAAGSDLVTERSMPWKYPLHKIVVRPEYREVAALLLQDGLVSQRTLDLATSAVASMATSLDVTHVEQMLSAAPVLSAFGQEFDYRFGVNSGCLCLFASADAIYRQYTRRIASFWAAAGPDRVGKRREYSPFEGSAICCFERSTLPEHAGKRVIVIRINRFVDNDPIRDVPAPDGRVYPIEELRPREGELLKVMLRGKVGPWAVDVDKEWKRKIPRGRILRVLFENEELYGSGSPLQSRI